jgi:hypothetical protein
VDDDLRRQRQRGEDPLGEDGRDAHTAVARRFGPHVAGVDREAARQQ